MKFTQEQVTEILKTVGLADVEIVDTEDQSDFDNDTVLQAIDESRTPFIKAKVEGEIATKIAGKQGGALDRVLVRTTNIDVKKLEGLKDEDKIKLAIEHKMSLLDQDKQSIQAEIDSILEKHNKELETTRNEYEGKLTEAEQRYIDRDITTALFSELQKAPLKDGADKMVLTQDFKKHLADKYHLSYDEAGKMVNLFNKEKKDLPAMNAAQNAKINVLDEAKEYFAPRSLWVTDMRDKNPKEELSKVPTQSYTNNTVSANGNKPQRAADVAAGVKNYIDAQIPTA